MAGANISNLPSLRQHRDTPFAHYSLAASFTLGLPRSISLLFHHCQHRHFRTSTNTLLSPSSTPFHQQSSSSVFLYHLPRMAGNTESSHRRTASAASSVDGAVSNDGTLSGPASTVPTARSTPFIGPQNHPGIPPQHHPATIGPNLDNADVLGELTAQLEDPAFSSQLDEVQTQIRMLGLHSHHTIQTPSSRYR